MANDVTAGDQPAVRLYHVVGLGDPFGQSLHEGRLETCPLCPQVMTPATPPSVHWSELPPEVPSELPLDSPYLDVAYKERIEGASMVAPHLKCQRCSRVGWWRLAAYGAIRECTGCGHRESMFMKIEGDAPAPEPTPTDKMKETVDAWSPELRREAYLYLHHAYKCRV